MCSTSKRRTAARQRRGGDEGCAQQALAAAAALRRDRAAADAWRATQVAHLLVHVFEACAGGDYSLASTLAATPTLSALEQSQRDLSDKRWTLQHAAGREPGAPPSAGGAAAGGAADVSPDALADALGGMGTLGGAAMEEEEQEPLEDGWERAPARRGRRAPPSAP